MSDHAEHERWMQQHGLGDVLYDGQDFAQDPDGDAARRDLLG